MSENNLDNIMHTTQEENDEIIKLLKVKKHILNFLDKKEIIKFLIKLVNKSNLVKFQRSNPENYIIPSMPVLELEVDTNKLQNSAKYKDLLENAGTDRTKILNVRSTVVKDEILTPFSNLMVDLYQVLVNNKEANKSIYRKDIDKILINDKVHPLAINSIYKVNDESELLFIFSLVYAVNFPFDNPDIDIMKDTSCAVEFLI